MVKENFIFELKREVLHILFGMAIILSVMFYDNTMWLLFFAVIAGAILCFFSLYIKIPVIYYLLSKFERPKYMKTFPGKGALFYFAGCLLALKLFRQDIALASIAVLVFGDSFSHLFGKLLKHKEKEIESAAIGIITATIAASFFVSPLFAFIGSCIAMAVEFIGLKLGQDNVDDNFFIPLVAGTVIYMLFKFI